MMNETIIVMQTSTIKFGFGATREVGFEMRRLGSRLVMIVADPNLVNCEPVRIVMDAFHAESIEVVL